MDEIKRAGTLTNFKTDHKVGWQSMSLSNLEKVFFFFSFICTIVKSLFLLVLNSLN